jgi:dolichyl-phosphate beta-glucosyltransferase
MISGKRRGGIVGDEIFLSVVIPAYNEEANIASTLTEVVEYLGRQSSRAEVIVVDDGSQDRTRELVEAMQHDASMIRLLVNGENKGKGYTVKQGMLAAQGRYTLFMDADNSVSIRQLDHFLPYLQQGFHIVMASRYLPGAKVKIPQPRLRVFMGRGYQYVSRLLIVQGVTDYNCGFKVYNAKARHILFPRLRMHDWSFDTELIFLARRFSLQIKEVPVFWEHRSTSKVKPLRDGLKTFFSLLQIKMNDSLGRYV